MDDLINELVRNVDHTAALQLELGFVPCLCLLPDLGMGLSFQLDPRGVIAAGLSFGLLCGDTLRRLARSRLQLVDPRCPIILLGFILRAGPQL